MNMRVFMLFITLFISCSPLAESASSIEAEKAADREAMRPIAESLGLSDEEFESRHNALMKARISLPQNFTNLVEAEPTYAGTWVTYQPNPMIVVAFAGTQGYQKGVALISEIAKNVGGFWVKYIKVQKAPISQNDLNNIRAKYENVLNANKVQYTSGIGLDEENKSYLSKYL